MKVICAALALWFAATASQGEGLLPLPNNPVSVSAWLASLGPRREGSPEEAQVFNALDRWFGLRTTLKSESFTLPDETSFSHRVSFLVPGAGIGEIVVVVPTDGTNDVGIAWAAAWADRALSDGTPLSLRFLFTGAERESSRGLGSRDFLQDYFPAVPVAALYLDASVDSPAVRLITESGLTPSPLWMVRGLVTSFRAQKLDPKLDGPSPSIFRLDLPERRTPLSPWLNRSIPAVEIVSGPASSAAVQALSEFVKTLSGKVPEHWDRHWLAFNFGFTLLFLPQQAYLIVLLLMGSALMLLFAFRGQSPRSRLTILTTGFWQLPALFSVLALSLLGGTAAVEGLISITGRPEVLQSAPLSFWAFKTLVALSLYFAVFIPFRRSPLTRDPAFYAQAALAWLIVLTLMALVLELSFSFYFLWALVCGILAVLFPWRLAKALAILLAPFWVIRALAQVLGSPPDLVLTHGLLQSPIAGNLTFAVLVGPFLLLVHHWYYTQKQLQDRNETLRAGLLVTLGAGLAGLVGFYALNLPLPKNSRIAVPTEIDLNLHPRPELLSVTKSQTPFLGRTTWRLVFSGRPHLEQLNLRLESSQNLTLYESSFPTSLNSSGKVASILIGRQPPLPLVLSLTLPATTEATLFIHALWVAPTPLEANLQVVLSP